MKRTIAMITLSCLLFGAIPFGVYAKAGEEPDPSSTTQEAESVPAAQQPKDNLVTTKHTAVIKGKSIPYTATTGSMVVESGGQLCEMFFTAYTVDDEKSTDRPITFAYNGGPGSSCSYIHMGCLGPRRVELDDTGAPVSLPAKITDNGNSLLDITDLVFIDPVGTGYSHAVDPDKRDEFIGYDNDIRSVGDFIRLYINRYKRWGSEKYLAGESYGTVRTVGLCKYLSDTYSMFINGLMLISSVNNYASVFEIEGNEIPYATYLPTYAADAWYHKALSDEYTSMKLEDFLDEVREFVSKEYVPALFMGNRITDEEKDQLAGKIASYTGLSKDHVLGNNLRISLEDFCSELLKDKKLMVGRLDGRFTGPVTSGSIEDGASDPSEFTIDIATGNTYVDYLTTELEFQTDIPFVPLSLDVNYDWQYPGYNGLGTLSQEQIIYECMSKNPFMKVWVLCGYYDSATPFYGAEWVYSHVFLNDEDKDNLSFTYYPSGHMIYIDKASFDKFRSDAEKWYAAD